MKKLIILLMLLFTISLVYAAGEMPSMPVISFYGGVTVNGVAAEDGTMVEAKIGNTLIGAESTASGDYYIALEDPYGDRDGETVTFWVDGYETQQTATFDKQEPPLYVELDLGVSYSIESTTTSSRGGGGGGGGGGSLSKMQCEDGIDNDGDGLIDMDDPGCQADWDNTENSDGDSETRELPAEESECVPDWTCSDWIECTNGYERRICVDSNKCNLEEDMPEEMRECETTKELLAGTPDSNEPQISEAKDSTFLNRITGAVTGGGTASWIVGIVVVAVVAGLIIFFATRKK